MKQAAIFTIDVGESEFCDYGWRLAADRDTAVRFVRGRKMKAVSGLFDEISAACQFPYYFGENWPAFEECLGDLDWLNASRFVLMISEFDQILAGEPDEMSAFARALRNAMDQFNTGRTSDDQDSRFRVIVRCGQLEKPFNDVVSEMIGSPTVLRI
jgi:hypothetical protein